tara:strand:+ start:17948 stop:19597 length:1650 start_codon:yes stop_codon:yes gene_type:complete
MTEQVMQTIKITDHPTHGEFNVEVPEGMDDSAVNQYVSNLDLNLLLGAGRSKMKGEEVEQIKQFENSNKAGFKNDRWTPVPSLEGGTDTIAYGHKLTPEEVQSGIIKIGDTEVKYADGLTEEQAVALFTQDGEWAKGIAEDSLGKSGLELTPNRVEALTSLIYNVGSGSWGKSKAKQYLESGNIEDFMHEAFDPEVGFVKINGEVSRGLVRRRGEEARLFGESDIAQGGSFGTMISEVLSKFNPISEAAAGTLPPTAEATPQTLLKRNSKDTESVGKLQDMLGMDVGEDRGIFGPATEAAVKAFQKEQGLTVDGIVGKDTFAALESSESEGESIFSRLNPFSSAEANEVLSSVTIPNTPDIPSEIAGREYNLLESDHAELAINQVFLSLAEQSGLPIPKFLKRDIVSEDFTNSVLKVIKKVALDKFKKGKGSTTYTQFGKDVTKVIYSPKRLKAAKDNQLGELGVIGEVVLKSFIDPQIAAAFAIGRSTNIYKDERGHLILTDIYDYEDDGNNIIGKLFGPDGYFPVSKKNARKIYLDLGPIDTPEVTA